MKLEREMTGLTCEELCDLMCGKPEDDYDDEDYDDTIDNMIDDYEMEQDEN